MIVYDRAKTSYLRQRQRGEPSTGRWAEYEQRKAAWCDMNPLATPAEYQGAMTRLARECGV